MRIVLTKNGVNIIKEIDDVPRRRNRTYDSSYSSVRTRSNVKEDSNPFDNLNKKNSNYKEITLTEKKLKIPFEMEEKYIKIKNENEEETLKSLNSSEQLLPDILSNINKSIENDSKVSSSNTQLPIIKNSYPIKYIISPKSYQKLSNDVKLQKQLLKRGKKLTEDNFRSVVYEDPQKIFDKNSSFEINTLNRNLIMYLNTDETISNSYIAKLNKYNKEKIKKLNKICQNAFYYKEQEKIINKLIKKKLRSDIIHINDSYKEQLDEMKNDLEKSKSVLKNGELPKFDNRERYLNQIFRAERDWSRFNTARFYKKSNPPITSLYNRKHDEEEN
jgi:hypothetical protein